MFEIEVKILDIDREKVEGKLISLGAEKIFDGKVHAFYYDDRRNSIRANRTTLRLRKEGGRSVFTLKADIKNTDAKVREEKEVTVSDFDTMKSILETIGFSPWLEMEKNRTTYVIPGVHFEFDKYMGEHDYIPEFLEIEATDIKTVLKYAELLGFKKEDCRPWDAMEVSRYYAAMGRRKPS